MKMRRRRRKLLFRTGLAIGAAVVLVQLAAHATRWSHNRRVAGLGDRLHVETHGTGAPVVFLHGLRGSGSYWSGLVQSLNGAVYQMIVPDLLGFGHSPWPVKEYSVEDHLDALDRSIEMRGSRMILVGHSMGAILAAEYARRHPDDVAGLVLLNAPIFDSEKDARKRIREMSSMAAAFSLNRWLARASCDLVCATRPVLWHIAPLLEKNVPPEVARDAVLHRWKSFDGSLQRVVLPSRLDKVMEGLDGIPIIFIHGETDPVTTLDRVRRLSDAIGAEVFTVPGGHNVLLDHPDETASIVREAVGMLRGSEEIEAIVSSRAPSERSGRRHPL
jgi:pimeloyl-ACP methyl ester carboxylesterase